MPRELYKMGFQVGDRWYEVEATDATLQDLCMGPHARKAKVEHAKKKLKNPNITEVELAEIMSMDLRGPQAHGELMGVRLRWPRVNGQLVIPPFSGGRAAA